MEAEDEMKDWVKQFVSEIERIEAFYVKQCEEYRQEFELLNKRYLQKTNGLQEQETNSVSVINERSDISLDEQTLNKKMNSKS